MVSASASSSGPAFSSIQGATSFSPFRAGRRLAGQPLPRKQADRSRQRHLLGRPGARDRIDPDPCLDQVRQVGADTLHRLRAQRLNTRHFQGIEHRPRLAIGDGCAGMVELGVMVPEAEGQRVGRSACFRHQPRLQRRAG